MNMRHPITITLTVHGRGTRNWLVDERVVLGPLVVGLPHDLREFKVTSTSLSQTVQGDDLMVQARELVPLEPQPVDPKDVTEGWWLIQLRPIGGEKGKLDLIEVFMDKEYGAHTIACGPDGGERESVINSPYGERWLKNLDLDQLARMP